MSSGTQQGNGCVYLLRPHLENVTGPQGWVSIELPGGVEDANSELGQLRDRFEAILIQHGFLFGNSTRAGGDELAASIKEAGYAGSDSIKSSVDNYKARTAPTDAPASFSRETHSRAATASSVTGTVAGYAQQATETIGSISQSVGRGIANTFGVGQKAEQDKSEARKGVEDAGRAMVDVSTGVADSAAMVGNAASTGATDALAHSKGQETADLAGHGVSTTTNIGKVAGAGLVGTSMGFHGAQAAQGVAKVDLDPEQRVPQQ
jgi:hypothetical protein